MKICAITMVYRDYWALAQWYAHFAGALGGENLFVVAHGADPKVQDICPGASVITVPRDSMRGFDRMRGKLLNGLQAALAAVYDWVIRTDADELVCLDPALHSSFADLFAAQTAPAIFALGLNLAEADGEAEMGGPVLRRSRTAVFSGHYSKAFAVTGRVGLMRHGVQARPGRVAAFDFCLPRGVYLVHLKFANLTALEASNAHREDVATRHEKGLPGRAWRKPDDEGARFYETLALLPEKPWDDARDEAHAALSADPVREDKTGLIRARNIRFDCRTTLPDWFAAG